MQKVLHSFKLNVDGKTLDYRLGQKLDLKEVQSFFSPKYTVKKLWEDQRHVLGILEKNHQDYFLKLATTEGVSLITQIEFNWNEQFNKLVFRNSSTFWVPQNIDSGFFQSNLFYLITDKFTGELLAEKPEKITSTENIINFLPNIIEFSQFIQKLPFVNFSSEENSTYQQWFVQKAEAWFSDIPPDIQDRYQVSDLLTLVKNGAALLEKRSRHGDFTPWHLFQLENGNLGLIDAEHAKANGVEYYDIAYFIQRVYCILENPDLAEKILSLLKRKNYNLKRLQTVLAARAIGGFLDESLKENSNYSWCESFKEWLTSLT